MIFSALVDADRRNTEEHATSVGRPPRPRDWPTLLERVGNLIADLDAHLAGLAKPDGNADLNRLRANILAEVKNRAEDERGLFTLTVPTGGGKTLTVTRFALDHARRWNLDRIVYAIPFAEARIETAWGASISRRRSRSLPRGSADRNTDGDWGNARTSVAPSRGRGSKRYRDGRLPRPRGMHPPPSAGSSGTTLAPPPTKE